MIIKPTKRIIQPTANLKINRSNKAGEAITTLIPFGVADYDLVTSKRLTFGSAASTHNDFRGRSLKSSGASACASIPIDLSSYTKLSLSFWLNWDSFANDDKLCLEYGASFIDNSGFLIDPNSGSTGFEVGVGSPGGQTNNWTFSRPSAGTWHHYVVNFDRTLGTSQSSFVWVNGVAKSLTLFAAAGNPSDSFGNNSLYIFSRNNSVLLGAGKIQNLVIRGGYLISDSEALYEYLNPWDLFEATSKQFFVPDSGSTTSGTPGYGTLDATGYAPTTTGNTTGIAVYGQAALTGQAVTGYSTTYGSAVYGSLTLTGQDPITTGITTGDVIYGQFTLTGQQPNVVSGTTGTAANGTLDYTGYAPTTNSSATTGTVNFGEIVLTGYAPGGYGTTTGTAISGDIALTGYTPTGYGTTTDTVNYGSLALTGYVPTSYSPGSGIITQGDIDAIANAVWAHSSALLIEQRLLEAWGRLGLDPTAPLITGQTTITFGAIVMAMTEAAGNITVTRQ